MKKKQRELLRTDEPHNMMMFLAEIVPYAIIDQLSLIYNKSWKTNVKRVGDVTTFASIPSAQEQINLEALIASDQSILINKMLLDIKSIFVPHNIICLPRGTSLDVEIDEKVPHSATSLRNYDDAFTDCNKAVELEPSMALAYSYLGGIYVAQENWGQATIELSRAIDLDSKTALFYANRAYAYARNGQAGKAIEDINEAIALDPGTAEAYLASGTIYFSEKQWDNAIDDFSKAIELDAHLVNAYVLRAYAYHMNGKCEQAIDDSTKAIELFPLNGLAYYIRATARWDMEIMNPDWDTIINDLTYAINNILPSNVLDYAYINRSLAYKANNQYELACADLRKVLDISQDKDVLEMARTRLEDPRCR